MATLCVECHSEAHEDTLTFPKFFNSWELSACYEIKRQIQLSQHDIDHDAGVLMWVEKAGQDAGWPQFHVMNLLQEAAEAGVMNDSWLRNLRRETMIAKSNKGNY